MADPSPELLKNTPTDVVTSQAPTGGLSAGQIEQPFRDAAATLGKFGDVANDFAVPAAQRQAATDLANQKVVRNPDGSVGVLNPASAMILGDGGRAYARAVQEGTADQILASVRPDLAALHAANPLDGPGLGKANDAYLTKLQSSVAGQGVIGQQVMRSARDMAVQHQDSAIMAGATNTMENTKKAILATVEDKKNALFALANTPGGPNKPEWDKAKADYIEAQGKLSSNDFFKMPAELIATQRKEFFGELQATQAGAKIDQLFDRKGKAYAQQEALKILQNPDIPPEKANLIYRQTMSRLEYRTNDQIAAQQATRYEIQSLRELVAKRPDFSLSDPLIAQTRAAALKAGGPDLAQEVDGIVSGAQAARATKGLPLADVPAALGVPPAAGGNDYFAITRRLESGGNDNAVSRNPATGAPIAYGRYQFTAGTWRGLGAAHPELGLTGENILDPNKQEAAVRAFTNDNAKVLQGQGLQATPANLRMAAFLGSGGGPQFLKAMQANPNADASAMFPQAAQANPSIFYGKEGHPRSLADIYGLMTSKFGGAQMNGAPQSINGNAFGPEMANNQWARSEYFRILAGAPSERGKYFETAHEGSINALKAGILPAPEAITTMIQTSGGDPEKEAKVDAVLGMVAAQKASQGQGGGGAAPMTTQQIGQAADDMRAVAAKAPDMVQQNLALSMSKQFDAINKHATENPLAWGADHFGLGVPPSLDASQPPQQIAQALAQRAIMAEHIGSHNQAPAPGLLDKETGDGPALQGAMQGQNGAQLVRAISQTMRPQDLMKLSQEPAFRDALTGMSRSGDPAKMNAAYFVMDKLQTQNPLQFDANFKDGLKDLRAWQSSLAFYPPAEAAKRLMAQYDPSQAQAIEQSRKVADEALKAVSAASVVSKFNTGIPFTPFGTTAQAPASQMNGVAAQALKDDYANLYKDGFAATGDSSMADKFAMEKLALKYAVSPVNGNRVTAYAPERHYPKVGGSHDWMSEQLDRAIAEHLGVKPGATGIGAMATIPQGEAVMGETPASRAYRAPRALVPDQATQADISAGRPPSYQVIVQSKDGRFEAMTGPGGAMSRFRFDPAPYQKPIREANDALEQQVQTSRELARQRYEQKVQHGVVKPGDFSQTQSRM